MALSMDDIMAKFPLKKIEPIDGEPTYVHINGKVQLLYGNAASLPTPLGDGNHRHIGLIMAPALYTTLSTTSYVFPEDPGITPTYTVGKSVAARNTTRFQHAEAKKVFENHSNMEDALKALIVETIQDAFLCKKRHKYTGYLGVTARDLIDHLLQRYRNIEILQMRAQLKVSTRRNPTVDTPTVNQTLTNVQRDPTVDTPTVNQTLTNVKQALSTIRKPELVPAPNSSFSTCPAKGGHITGGHIEAAGYRSRFDTSDANNNIRYYHSKQKRTLVSSE